jgi:hypothetical protein
LLYSAKVFDTRNDAIKSYLFTLVVADLQDAVYFSHTVQSYGIFFLCFQPTALEVYLGVIGRKMLKTDIKYMVGHEVDWIHLVQDRGKWRAVVNYGNEPSDSKNASKFFD